jgi:Arylsulfotransferase (ASST)
VTEKDWTRRQVLVRAGTAAAGTAALGLAGCGGAAVVRHHHAARRAADVQHFVSRPDLRPPAITMFRSMPGKPGYVFLNSPQAGPGQGGAMLLDTAGRLVWFSPVTAGNAVMDFARQSYQGIPVLTWWEGKIVSGHGDGVAVIADSSYRRIHTIRAGAGLMADLHDFVLTPQGTALITAFGTASADLSGVGGPANGTVWSGVVQEIDIPSGNVLFQWDSLDHVAVTESYVTYSGGANAAPFDYFHVNSIAVAADGDLLISARNTCTVYKIARPSGAITWRLGGKKSSFAFGPGARFYWQHDARPLPGGGLSLFDDGASPPKEKRSRAIVLDLDTWRMRATLGRRYVHPVISLLATAMGSAQVLPDGGMFVGWGTEPYFSEFSRDGRLLLDGRLPANDPSYRAFNYAWSGRPADPPAAGARARASGGATVYASWNGATDVRAWTVLAGKTRSSLSEAGSGPRTGFETAITVHSSGPYFAVEPRDANAQVLARSAPVALRGA